MSPSRLRTVRDHIRWAVSRFHEAGLFFGHGTDNAWDDARQLVLGALHLPFEIADGYLDCRLEEDEQQHLLELIRRRVEERVPTAYLLGEAWFCGLPFVVDERVLVPRSPIAELIGQQFEPWLPALRQAIRDEERLVMNYVDADGQSSERTIWPFAMAFFDPGARLIAAWCELRNGFRHFRAERVVTLLATGRRYPVRRHVLIRRWRAEERQHHGV